MNSTWSVDNGEDLIGDERKGAGMADECTCSMPLVGGMDTMTYPVFTFRFPFWAMKTETETAYCSRCGGEIDEAGQKAFREQRQSR